uniref:Uncharacterized protein n=1 Tax=Lepeophtheirus salmonis TaxID=72036 RepID=A0A0K2UY41_LEPSM
MFFNTSIFFNSIFF